MAAAGPGGPAGSGDQGSGGVPSYPTRHKRDIKQKKLTKRLGKKRRSKK